ncbi:MAG: YegP family protein [Candidatus Bathyarchaeota archaeon]|nr:YegP family protein [Candidatus Bathyarchaeota archaeon]
MSKKYQVYRDVQDKFRFRLMAENNKIIAVGEAYEQHASCIKGIKSIQANCNAEIEDLTVEGPRINNPKYQVFFDKSCGYRFHLTATNGEIIAASEGYEAKSGCLNGIHAVKASCDAEIEDLTTTQKPKEDTMSYDALELPPVVASEPAPAPVRTVTDGPVPTTIELQSLSTYKKDDPVFFKGRLVRSDSGEGIPKAKIDIYERDRSLLGDDFLAYGYTSEDGTFKVDWRARSLTWFENTGQVYAYFKGTEDAKPSKSTIQKIIIE